MEAEKAWAVLFGIGVGRQNLQGGDVDRDTGCSTVYGGVKGWGALGGVTTSSSRRRWATAVGGAGARIAVSGSRNAHAGNPWFYDS